MKKRFVGRTVPVGSLAFRDNAGWSIFRELVRDSTWPERAVALTLLFVFPLISAAGMMFYASLEPMRMVHAAGESVVAGVYEVTGGFETTVDVAVARMVEVGPDISHVPVSVVAYEVDVEAERATVALRRDDTDVTYCMTMLLEGEGDERHVTVPATSDQTCDVETFERLAGSDYPRMFAVVRQSLS